MAYKKPTQITSWSFSRYSTYRQCPLKAKLKFIDKMEEPTNDAMARGAAIHDTCEKYLKGTVARMPAELKLFADDFKKLKAQYKKRVPAMVVEDMWAFTKDWDETRWNDWANCWVRIKLDCAHFEDETTLVVTDFKTGKFRPDKNEEYMEQLELYALAALLMYPEIEGLVVKPRLMYLDAGVIYPEPGDDELVYTAKDIGRLQKLWAKRVRPMLNDKKFPPRANNFCSWCHFRKSNGGPCKF